MKLLKELCEIHAPSGEEYVWRQWKLVVQTNKQEDYSLNIMNIF